MAFIKSEKENEITYEIKEDYGELSKKVKFRLISWNGAAPKYDIRQWYTDKNGMEKMGKGITLTGEEMEALYKLLKKIAE